MNDGNNIRHSYLYTSDVCLGQNKRKASNPHEKEEKESLTVLSHFSGKKEGA